MRRALVLMVLLQAFGTPMMLSSVNIALPHIARALAMDPVSLTWVPMTYLAASAMLVLICGRLADRYGRKRFFLIGAWGSLFSSLCAAAAGSEAVLLGARFLQGVSAAALYATQIALISSVFPGPQRGKIIGLVTSAIYFGLAAGPLVGGLCVQQFGWRASFLTHIPLMLAALWLAHYRVPGEWAAGGQSAFDIPGALLYVLVIALLCVGVACSPSLLAVLLPILGLGCLVQFVRHERRAPAPLFDVRLFQGNRMFSLSCLAAWLQYTATYGNVVLLVLYLHYLQGLDITAAALLVVIQPLVMSLTAPLSGRCCERFGARRISSLGLLFTACGLLLLSRLQPDSGLGQAAAGLVLTGVGIGLFVPPNSTAVMNSVSREVFGVASAALSTVRILGQLGSMALISLVFALAAAGEGPGALQGAIAMCFVLAALLTAPALYCSWTREAPRPAPITRADYR